MDKDVIVFLVFFVFVISTVILAIKNYRFGKRYNYELPGCFWNVAVGLFAGSIILSPIALVMECVLYYKLNKSIKEANNSPLELITNNHSFMSQSANMESVIEEGGIELYSEEDVVVYYDDEEKSIYNLDSKVKYRHKIKSELLVKAFDYVKQGDELMLISLGKYKGGFSIVAKEDGYFVDGATKDGSFYYSGDHLFTIYKSFDSLQKDLFPTLFDTGVDGFTKKPYIKATMYGGDKGGFFIGWIYIRIEFSNGKHRLHVDYCSKDIQFTKGQSLHFLLEDGSVLSFSNFTKPIKCKEHKIKNSDINTTTSSIMTTKDVKALADHPLVKWQWINDEGSVLCELEFPPKVYPQVIYKRVFQRFASVYLSLLDAINHTAEEEIVCEEEQKSTSTCFVYLMIDTTNNFHKIGISNNPRYREHTLQSDKPTIELLCAKEFPSRAMAEAFEASLHKVYASKRIRGEWFNLDDSNLKELIQTLK